MAIFSAFGRFISSELLDKRPNYSKVRLYAIPCFPLFLKQVTVNGHFMLNYGFGSVCLAPVCVAF